MNEIPDIEDALIAALSDTQSFRLVQSIGRKDRPVVLTHPAAFVLFLSDKKTGSAPRPVYDTTFAVMIVNKNLASSAAVAKDTYSLLGDARDAIQGKTLGLDGIEPFVCSAMDITQYDSGELEYTLQFNTRRYLPVPTE